MRNDEKKRLGQWGEALAANYLYTHGYTVLRHHYAVRGGEIDLIACKGDVLAVVEVKLRTGDLYPGAEAVTACKRRCLRRAMDAWLMEHPEGLARNIRFDVCQITAPLGMGDPAPEITYYENAFYCEEG